MHTFHIICISKNFLDTFCLHRFQLFNTKINLPFNSMCHKHLKIFYLHYLKEKGNSNRRERERVFYPLVYSPLNACNTLGSKPGAKSSSWVAENKMFKPPSAAFPGSTLTEAGLELGGKTQTSQVGLNHSTTIPIPIP